MPPLSANQLVTAVFLAVAPVLPVFAQDTSEQWTAILIGDSWLPEAVRLYTDRIATDLDVDIFYTQRTTASLHHANRMLESGAWDAVRGTEIIVVGLVSMNDRPGYCTDQVGDTPLRWPLEEVEQMIDRFVASLAERVDPKTQLVRIALEDVIPDDLARWTENGHLADCMHIQKRINAAWAAGAQKQGFGTVDYFSALNGLDGTDQPPGSFFMPDGRHLSPEGAQAAADLLYETGYQPLVP